MTGRRAGFLVLLVAAVRLVAAPPEPIQKPVKLLGLGENVDREFAKLTDIGITPSLTYYGVFQGNPMLARSVAEREHAERRNAPRGQRRRYPRTKNFYVIEALNALLADHGLSQFCVVEEDEESSPRRVRRFSVSE